MGFLPNPHLRHLGSSLAIFYAGRFGRPLHPRQLNIHHSHVLVIVGLQVSQRRHVDVQFHLGLPQGTRAGFSSLDCLALLKYRSMEFRFRYSSFHALLNRGIIPMVLISLPVGFSQCVSLQ